MVKSLTARVSPRPMSATPITICADPETLVFENGNSGIFLRHWQGLRTNGAVPYAEAVDPVELKALLPEIVIFDLPDLSTVRFRLAGTLAAKRLGFEPKGMNLAEFATPETRPLVTLAFNVVARAHVGILSHYRPVFNDDIEARIEMLILPLLPPVGEPPRVISLVSREALPPERNRFGIKAAPDRIEDACVFDIGFGLPNLSTIPGLSVAA